MIRPERDVRIDFCRGLALWMIFTDHINGNFLRHFTYQSFGFSDAADIFVFLSGISSCLLYYQLMVTEGFKRAQLRALRRAAQIYLGYLSVVVATFLLTLSAHYVYSDGYEWVLARPAAAFVAAVFLDFAPGLNSILPLYIVLLAATPLLLIALKRLPSATIVASVLLWLGVQKFGWNLPNHPPLEGWEFDPAAWQVLFCAGLWVGLRYYHGQVDFRSHEVVRALCWVIVAANVAFGVAAHSGKFIGEIPLLVQMNEFWNAVKAQNTTEHWLRLSHFLAVAYLVASYVPAQTAILRKQWCQPILLCGRFSLQSYCLGAVLSLVGSIYIEMRAPDLAVQVLINLLGWSLMTVFAAQLALMRRGRRALVRPHAMS